MAHRSTGDRPNEHHRKPTVPHPIRTTRRPNRHAPEPRDHHRNRPDRHQTHCRIPDDPPIDQNQPHRNPTGYRSQNVHHQYGRNGRRPRRNRDGPQNRSEDCEVASPR
ncbi:hypothetical protein GCM10010530_77330 [Kribbella aluminosa]